MTPRSLANTVYLKCLTFTISALLAASHVGAEGGNDGQTRRTGGVVGGVSYNNHSVCYDSQKQEVKCTRKKAIIVGTIISSLFVILGALYLYATCSDRRKKRKGPSTEENEPLSSGTGNISDLEKGPAKASDDGFTHPDSSDESSVSSTSPTASDLPSYDPPGFTSTYKPLETSDLRPTRST